MPYDEQLLKRVRALLAGRSDVTEKRMFGSITFMVRGHMACGPHNDSLIVRIGAEAAAEALREPNVRPMDFTGRVMKAFVTIDLEGLKTDKQLRRWVETAANYAALELTAKPKSPKKGRRQKKSE